MIYLTRLNHEKFVLNSDLIQMVETTPDTVLSLTTGEKLRVRESVTEVIRSVIDFRRMILAGASEIDHAGGAGVLSVIPQRGASDDHR